MKLLRTRLNVIERTTAMLNMPIVNQPVNSMSPTRYTLADGPTQILDHSKDLAFELYTIPEPATFALVALALVGGTTLVRRRHV